MDLSYVAGLFDGEGCIVIDLYDVAATPTRPKAYTRSQLRVTIGMNHFPTIRALYDQFGGMIARDDSNSRKNSNHAIKYTWVHWSGHAAKFLEAIEPFMITKREQAIIAIKFQRHLTQCDPIFRKHRGVPPNLAAIRSKREKWIAELRRHKAGRFDIPKHLLKTPRQRWPYAAN